MNYIVMYSEYGITPDENDSNKVRLYNTFLICKFWGRPIPTKPIQPNYLTTNKLFFIQMQDNTVCYNYVFHLTEAKCKVFLDGKFWKRTIIEFHTTNQCAVQQTYEPTIHQSANQQKHLFLSLRGHKKAKFRNCTVFTPIYLFDLNWKKLHLLFEIL